jgi:arylsulfatase A-like enzyme
VITRILGFSLLVACSGGAPADGAADEAEEGEAKSGKAARKAGKKPKPEKPELAPEVKAAPNILLIVWDTARADRMSAYGYNKPTTPRVEAWSKNAVRYDRAVSAGVWTLPSHASMFTGLPERGHGVNADHNWLDSGHLTVPEVLQARGFDTYTFCANPYLAEDTNVLQGFDRKDYPWRPKWRDKVDAHMRGKLIPEDASTPVSPKFEGKGGADNNRYLFKEAGPVASEALFSWISERPEQDRPFFAFVNLMEAHLPRIPGIEARRAVMTPEEIARSYTVEQSTTYFHEWMVGVRKYDPLDLAAISGVYDASLIDLDAATGALLDELDKRGLAEDTIVILTSDHGENLGDHELMLHKYAVYDTLVRVPLIVAWKGHLEARVEAAPRSVAHALLDALDLAKIQLTPEERAKFTTWPAAAGEGVLTEYTAVADGSVERMKKLHPDKKTDHLEREYEAVVDGEWKYIEGSDGSRQLYRLGEDPGETKNLVEVDPARATELDARLDAWLKRIPEYTPTGEASGHKRSDELKEGLEALGYVEEK